MKLVERSEPGQAVPDGYSARETWYAIYYTPAADHPLTRAAETWLGRSAFPPREIALRPEIEPDREAVIAQPRRYGFHATLKAPFRLAKGNSIATLEQALSKFTRERRPCPIGPLKLNFMRGFFAFVPHHEIPGLRALAREIVEKFDPFRAAVDEAELKRRLLDPLDDEETTHLVRWGYPYVFDRFRFHMTLTDRRLSDRKGALQSELQEHFGDLLTEDYRVDAITLFEQKQPLTDFTVRARFTLEQRGVE
ncbi:DUF1045 domain-containing protein [Rhizobium sp. 1AS11]|uniref:DUF1045 domain-containing protein n=1 Tax=Rhizobium acaciae TaxID=2989736 RepID=UPI0022236D03|nr:DUF1045 domain-containing protein [Rhizobium acaciae]MCW1412982.1 DUF1045 domain-containing protein [Rhizobium acaciae]MCW1745134.1 DUF1045 domain-containing protein [Rhizobium acaciae]